ncbi:TPA: hypothetical protein ACGJZJ_001569 [Pseudomonas aeruginosa]|uniref:hypothetical protein n=1 Tax=Pseudomonas aeruginosa TaxID=287 RepID=UPI00053DF73F|nr:hypothetical protein [Pseudomonas aeruginosa]
MKHVVSSALLLGLSSLSLAAQAAPIALDLPAQPLAASLEQLQGASGLRIRFDRAAVADRRAPALRGTLVRESEINQKGKARKLWDIEEGKGI